MRAALLALLLAACRGQQSPGPRHDLQVTADPSYDLQTATYVATHKPVSVSAADVTATPFFSPDSSMSTLVALIDGAQDTLDVGTPGFSSWIGCMSADDACMGCPIDEQRNNETFAVFPALLNAAHRGVQVRLLTPDFGDSDCAGAISALPFLQLQTGVEVRWYDSTTFLHSKYMCADCASGSERKRVAVSSVNFSKTSFLLNREAGAVLEGPDADPLVGFTQGVFEADWASAQALAPPQDWTAAQLAAIRDPAPIDFVEPLSPLNSTGYFVAPSPPVPVSGAANWSVYASPDWAFDTLLPLLQATQRSLDVYVYQVTEPTLCALLGQLLVDRGVAVRLLVSEAVYDPADCALANQCYANLTAAGLTVLKTTQHFKFAHQKFWIRDGETLGWSTGNFSPSDYPASGSRLYPPFGDAGWAVVNRDLNVVTDNADVLAVFQAVFEGDLADPGVLPWTEQYEAYCYAGDD